MAMYHWEADQEDFLVVSGQALLIVEGEERPLRVWDFVHCPPPFPARTKPPSRSPRSGAVNLMVIPEFIWEAFLGIYCAIWGFRKDSPILRPTWRGDAAV